MAFSFSAPACTCCFLLSREFFQFIFPRLKPPHRVRLTRRIIYGSRGLIKHGPALNRQPPDRFIIDLSVGLDNFFRVLLRHSPPLRLVGAAEGSGHGGREELAGDLGQRGDHDGGLFPEGVSGSGQEEGGPDHHRLRDRAADWHPQEGNDLPRRFLQ